MMKFQITPAQIDRLVAAFYARIRADEVLGPIFIAAIGTGAEEWRAHEAKIAGFWRNATGIDRAYSGNPMVVHASNHAIQPVHFDRWLALFRETATEVLPDLPAQGIAALADRIGQSLAMGMVQFRQRFDTAPDLS